MDTKCGGGGGSGTEVVEEGRECLGKVCDDGCQGAEAMEGVGCREGGG